jgi:putative ABC transport system permease protein
MYALLQDLRFATRALRRRRAFAAVAVATVALGIGAATSIYSIVDGVLLRPLPFHEPGRIVGIWQTFPEWKKEPILASSWDRISLAMPEFRDLRDQARSFASVGIWSGGRALLVDGDRTELVPTLRTSATLLDVLGVRPVLGRMFLPGEDVPNAAGVTLVSWEQWQSRFGGDRNVLGRVVRFEETPYTIVGVLPRGLTVGRTSAREGERPAFWVPVGQVDTSNYNQRSNHSYTAIARLAPGVTMERALDEATRILAEHNDPAKEGTRLVEWQTDQTRDARAPMLILLSAVGLLLLIACVNVAMLLLGESASREQEMAARIALGANRARLVRQLLTESVALAAVGGALGVALAWGGTRVLVALAPPRLPGVAAVGMDLRVLGVALAATVTTGILFGLAPALALSHASPATLMRAGAGQSARGRGSLQRGLVAVELALSVVLLVGAALLGRSFERITRVDPGFRAENLLVVNTSLPQTMLRDSLGSRQIYEGAVARLAAIPGVTAATTVSQAPFGGGSSSSSFTIEGETGPEAPGGGPAADGAKRHQAQQRVVFAGYFAAMGIPLLAGREFTPDDRSGAPNVVVVSEALARRDFPAASPLGKRVRYQGQWWTIAGIVGDVRYQNLTKELEPAMYTAFGQRRNWSTAMVIRTVRRPDAIVPDVRRVLDEHDRRLTLTSATPMSELIRRSFAEERYRAALMSLFGALAAVLAAVGMYGVTARSVARRAREVGIRIALGATEWAIVRQVVGSTLVGLVLGVALGLVGAALAARVLSPLLFGVSATDPAAYVAIVLLLAATGVVASWIPARRAGRIPPATVLRAE